MVAFVILFITFILAFIAGFLCVLFGNNFRIARVFGLIASVSAVISLTIGAIY